MGLDDALRHRPLRLLGYAHVVGSALPADIASSAAKAWMTRATMAYIAFDIVVQATDKRPANFLSKGFDATLWQGMASIMFPAFVVQGAVQLAANFNNGMRIKSPNSRYVSLGFVLLSMPLLGVFLDNGAHAVLNLTTRPLTM